MMITNKERVEELAKSISLISRQVEYKINNGSNDGEVTQYVEYYDELRRRYTSDIKVARRSQMLRIISDEIDEYLDV